VPIGSMYRESGKVAMLDAKPPFLAMARDGGIG
jgi:hypothetical protein